MAETARSSNRDNIKAANDQAKQVGQPPPKESELVMVPVGEVDREGWHSDEEITVAMEETNYRTIKIAGTEITSPEIVGTEKAKEMSIYASHSSPLWDRLIIHTGSMERGHWIAAIKNPLGTYKVIDSNARPQDPNSKARAWTMTTREFVEKYATIKGVIAIVKKEEKIDIKKKWNTARDYIQSQLAVVNGPRIQPEPEEEENESNPTPNHKAQGKEAKQKTDTQRHNPVPPRPRGANKKRARHKQKRQTLSPPGTLNTEPIEAIRAQLDNKLQSIDWEKRATDFMEAERQKVKAATALDTETPQRAHTPNMVTNQASTTQAEEQNPEPENEVTTSRKRERSDHYHLKEKDEKPTITKKQSIAEKTHETDEDSEWQGDNMSVRKPGVGCRLMLRNANKALGQRGAMERELDYLKEMKVDIASYCEPGYFKDKAAVQMIENVAYREGFRLISSGPNGKTGQGVMAMVGRKWSPTVEEKEVLMIQPKDKKKKPIINTASRLMQISFKATEWDKDHPGDGWARMALYTMYGHAQHKEATEEVIHSLNKAIREYKSKHSFGSVIIHENRNPRILPSKRMRQQPGKRDPKLPPPSVHRYPTGLHKNRYKHHTTVED